MSYSDKDTTRVVAGYKAALHNPNVSEEAKANAAQKIAELGGTTEMSTTVKGDMIDTGDEHTNRQLGGMKATLHNPHTSDEAKAHAKEVLEAAGYQVEMPSNSTPDEHEKRVLAGYRAAISNPRVSAEAKRHAREYLAAHGETA